MRADHKIMIPRGKKLNPNFGCRQNRRCYTSLSVYSSNRIASTLEKNFIIKLMWAPDNHEIVKCITASSPSYPSKNQPHPYDRDRSILQLISSTKTNQTYHRNQCSLTCFSISHMTHEHMIPNTPIYGVITWKSRNT